MLHFLLYKGLSYNITYQYKNMNKYLCGQYRNIIVLVLFSWSLKLLMMSAYYSTDFAVHQNWLRITHEKPLSQWYYDEQSKWTLDYPPLFAYFQYFLSKVANAFSQSIVKTINQFPQTVTFQRLSVIVTDIFYLWALLRFNNNKISLRVVILYLWIPFIILDNIHFQYNLLMQALMVFSVGFMQEKRFLVSAFCFSALLNFKHIYLYCAPAFFVYLLKQYVFKSNKSQIQDNQNSLSNIRNNQQQKHENFVIKLIRVGIVTLIPFIVSFGPFFIADGIQGIKQIFSRLFPFGRGLIHQYWAPNFWALYYLADKILMAVGFKSHQLYKLVDASTHQISAVNTLKVLPQISPSVTILIILCLLTPIIISYFLTKKQTKFTNLMCMSGLLFFMFGFHVHEKAIIPYLNLLFFFCPSTPQINTAVFISIVNLVPLLIQPKQKIFCVVCCLVWLALWDFMQTNKKQSMFNCQQQFIRNINWQNFKKVAPLYAEYIIQVSGILIVVYHLFVHPVIKSVKLQFLPFLLNSVWAASLNTLWVGYLYYKFIKQSLFNKGNIIEVQ